MFDKSMILIISDSCGPIILFLDFSYFSGIYCYFSAISVFIVDLLISLKNIIFAGNPYGDSGSTTTIIAESRQSFITGASLSEVPGESYTWLKSRTRFTGKWDPQK